MSGVKKILVADDEIHIAMAIKAILKKALPGYVVDHAKNGVEAWKMASTNDYQLVISDWNMPKKNGDELLSDLRKNNDTSKTPFMMLTARGDRDSYAVAAKAGVDDYLIKPFKAAEFVLKVKGLLEHETAGLLGGVQAECLADLVVDRFKKGYTNLPVLPKVVKNFNKLFESGDVTIEDIVKVVELDSAIALKLISIANSPLVRGASDCLSVERAITRLGLPETKNYIVALANKGVLVSENIILKKVLEDLWWHSLETAYCAKLLAIMLNHSNPDKLFLLGLLHDVGKLLLVSIVDDLSITWSEIDKAAVDEIMDSLHADFGSVLIRAWNFGDEFYDIVHFHHSPFDSENISFELLVIYLANLILGGDDGKDAVEITSSQAAIRLGLKSDMIMSVIEKTNEYVASARRVL